MSDILAGLISSGDLIADRRYRYAQAAAADGDHAAAAEIFEQALELAPNWAPLWFGLATTREKLGEPLAAVEAFSRAATLDPKGALGAELHLARLGARPVPQVEAEGYIRHLFDQYADRFDAQLLANLAYRGPDLLIEAIARVGAPQFSSVIDLGCGTGLCGAAFRNRTEHLTGVDLSPRMIVAARSKGIYDRLETASIDEFLAREMPRSADLVLAADVFVYRGDLEPVFTSVERVLEATGLFAFTLQRAERCDYGLGPDLRYAHSMPYVRHALETAGLRIISAKEASARTDGGADVPGLLMVAAKV